MKQSINLDVEIGKGLEPRIFKCKHIAAARRKKEHLDIEIIDSRLNTLRLQKCEQKLFAIKKELHRLAKKVCKILILKSIKKLKAIPEDDTNRRQPLEEQFQELKKLNLDGVVTIFLHQVVEQDELAREKLSSLITTPEDKDLENINNTEIIKSQAFKQRATTLTTELAKFLKTLYRLQPDSSAPIPNRSDNKNADNVNGKDDENESDKEKKPSHSAIKNPVKKRSQTKKLGMPKKNRKGQRARRAEWERLYGANARHLQQQDRSNDEEKHVAKRSRLRENDGNGKTADQRAKLKSPPKPALHPSWEAKRHQIELQKNATKGGPTHTKILFNDED